MSWDLTLQISVLVLIAMVAGLFVFAVSEAVKSARHRRDIEWLEAQRRTGLTIRKDS
jgi:uncharacterized integral membrane protein